ncbi:GGDEF domain-containing protein [Celerinatantimonas yamalensis]|uniref:diguanylate cyclase n=1 Tax=Celerinatantimonas yamalensis TaxID=559956 RepID=A0ABW9G4A5_9GAMM
MLPLSSMIQSKPHQWSAYQFWSIQTTLLQLRYSAFLTALLYVAYAVIEYHLHLPMAGVRLTLHGLIVPFMLLFIGVCSFYPRMYRIIRCLLVIAPVIAVFCNLWVNMGTAYFIFFAPELYLSIIWTLTISGLTYRPACLSAFASMLIVVCAMVVQPIPQQFFLLHILWLISAFMFGLVNATVIETIRKTTYLQQCNLEKSAHTDGLTGLWNRKKIDQLFVDELAKTNFLMKPITLIMIDIDHFKYVNDQYGHSCGDAVLQSFAAVLQQNIRQGDHIARIGGEEFVIVLPNTTLSQAYGVAQSLRKNVAQFKFGDQFHCTSSFGVAEYRLGESITDLMKRADQALYQAKDNGRDRVEVAADKANVLLM